MIPFRLPSLAAILPLAAPVVALCVLLAVALVGLLAITPGQVGVLLVAVMILCMYSFGVFAAISTRTGHRVVNRTVPRAVRRSYAAPPVLRVFRGSWHSRVRPYSPVGPQAARSYRPPPSLVSVFAEIYLPRRWRR